MAYCSYCAAVLDPGHAMCARCGRPTGAVDSRPASVGVAAMLLFISWIISLLSSASLLPRPALLTRMPGSVLVRIVAFSIVWLALTICIWQQQQNWARFAILLFLAYGIAMMVFTVLRVRGFVEAAVILAVPIVVNALRIGAAAMLFRSESSAWFKK